MPTYLKKRGDIYHFQRRIPKRHQEYFTDSLIRFSLETDSETVASQRAQSLNQVLLNFLDNLIIERVENKVDEEFKKAVLNAKQAGFQYVSKSSIVYDVPLSEFVNRINAADLFEEEHTKKAVLGAYDKPSIDLRKAAKEFYAFQKGNLVGYSDQQLQKWQNPRKKAVKNFMKVVGNKSVDGISREDMLKFRQWWVDRVTRENRAPNSANKEIGFIKQIIKSANNNHSLDIMTGELFDGLSLKEEKKVVRFPFSSDFIQSTFINDKLSGLNEEAKLVIHALIETGARIAEVTGLDEKDGDIDLISDVPHIKIRSNSIRKLKTPQSERDIPLVGVSLKAFQKLNGGFDRYLGKSDLASNTINKYFRENDLLPSEHHSLYSLRHSFEDRLTAVEPPEKIQAILMGHKYVRERYGLGPSLAQKRLWLNKIAFKV